MHEKLITEKDDKSTEKDYILNVKSVIDKKFSFSERDPIVVETHNKDGKERSPCTKYIQLGLGVYEELNSNNLATELMKRYDIQVEAKPKTPPAKAKTNIDAFGKAIVEYQGVAKFEAGEKEFKTNITMYNTTCAMMVQKLAGGNVQPSDLVPELGGVTVAEYFTQTFIIPMVNQMSKADPNLNAKWLEKLNVLKKQVEQYEETNKSKHLHKEKVVKKSVNKTPDNKCELCKKTIRTETFGTCDKCGKFEHFSCSGSGSANILSLQDSSKNYTCAKCTFPFLFLESNQSQLEENNKEGEKEPEIVENQVEHTLNPLPAFQGLHRQCPQAK